MDTQLRHTQRLLMALFWSAIVVAVVAVVLFESDTLPVAVADKDTQAHFLLTFVMELLTIASIPLALRLFRFRRVADELSQRQAHALRRWGVVRLALLEGPMLLNVLLYYLYMNTTFGYMGIIAALCLPFVYPSMNRCKAETEAS